ncbi:MAG: hypothetical protein JWN44_4933 [Myxococcales bacterium]|nr:hypothetical protein [Myxococcales bacterium]
MTAYAPDPSATLLDARDEYFRVNQFGPNGGYDDAWVDFKLGPIPLPFPNSPGRKRAVRFHDLHHTLTGYATDARGEFEISAWEIGSGCAGYLAAWQLNLGGMVAGMLAAPRRTWRAFLRGRQSRNLYRSQYDDALLSRRVAEMRRELALDRPLATARAADVALFALALVAGLAVGLVFMVLMIPGAIVANLAALARRR